MIGMVVAKIALIWFLRQEVLRKGIAVPQIHTPLNTQATMGETKFICAITLPAHQMQ
jgi:hypothetical protein